MGDWNRPRHLVLAVSSKIKDQSDVSFMHIHCLSHSVHLQHNICAGCMCLSSTLVHTGQRTQLKTVLCPARVLPRCGLVKVGVAVDFSLSLL